MTANNEELKAFDFIKAINQGRRVELNKNYSQYLTNKAFSYHIDTVAIANEMNLFYNASDDMHYEYMMSMIPVSNRWSKWYKPEKYSAANLISRFYQIPLRRAYDYVNLITEAELEEIREILEG